MAIETTEIRVALPTDYAREFKSRCARSGITMSSVIKEGIAKWMRENGEKKTGGVV